PTASRHAGTVMPHCPAISIRSGTTCDQPLWPAPYFKTAALNHSATLPSFSLWRPRLPRQLSARRVAAWRGGIGLPVERGRAAAWRPNSHFAALAPAAEAGAPTHSRASNARGDDKTRLAGFLR